MIVATAGHIDHGKTSLVKAITGVDTDRLPEEKARGISIDLGFAYWRAADGAPGTTLGFVDVPGHERFVRNMLAGVAGVDFVMLVVAADDGIMPQTIEHLSIVDLLGISHGVAVLTKCDRVDSTRREQVAGDVRRLLSNTVLSGIPVLQASARTGEGIEALRAALLAAAAQRRQADAGHGARFAIDRVFTIAGSGTVVTGTVFAGTISAGDRLLLSPSGREVRVRGLQHGGAAIAAASAGERCSLNLSGVEVSQVTRGDWVVAPALHSPTRRIDVDFRLLSGEPHALRHWTPIHLHLGTCDVTGRIALARGASLAPGDSANAQLVLDKSIEALHGDRFIVRDQSATRTLGGGVVIDHLAPARVRDRETRRRQLLALAAGTAAEALAQVSLHSPAGVDVSRFEINFNLSRERIDALLDEQALLVVGREPRVAFRQSQVDDIRQQVVTALERFHADQPKALGIETAELRRRLAPSISPETFLGLIRHLAPGLGAEVVGSALRLVRHVNTANPADERLWQRVAPLLESAGLAGLTHAELAERANVKEGLLKDFLHRKSRTGEVVAVTAARFCMRGALAQAAAIARSVSEAVPQGRFTAAQYRDRVPLGRTRAIELLECLDRLGITRRIGDARVMNRDYESILGQAQAPPVNQRAALPAQQPTRPATRSTRR